MKTMQKLIAIVALTITVMSCFAFSIIAAQIKPSNLTTLTAAQSANSVTLSWSKSKNATGYRVFRKVNGKWKKINATSKTKYTVKKLKKDTKYTFAVRPYAKNDKETVWAKKYKSVSVYTSDFIGTTKKVKATQKDESVTLSYSTAENAKGYRIYERLNGKWKSLKTTTATKYTIKNPKVGKHTFAVRPYTKFEGKTVWAKYTKVTVTIKPDTSIGKTSGGIKLYPITSSTAKKIASSSSLFRKYTPYEGKSANGKTVVVYAKSSNGWFGRDIDGTRYTSNGKIEICEYCGSKMGEKKDMCHGDCAVVFH